MARAQMSVSELREALEGQLTVSSPALLDLRRRDLSSVDLGNVYAAMVSVLDRDRCLSRVNFAGSNLSDSQFGFRPILGCSFKGCDLRGADFTGCDLTGCTFAGADMRGARLASCTMNTTSFTGADMRGAHLESSILQGPPGSWGWLALDGIDMTGAYLSRMTLARVGVRRCTLFGAHAEGLIAGDDVLFAGCDLRESDLRSAELRCVIRMSDLRDVRLDARFLEGLVLEDCRLDPIALQAARRHPKVFFGWNADGVPVREPGDAHPRGFQAFVGKKRQFLDQHTLI